MSKYRITLTSDEERAASSPNIVALQFASDADAEQFGANLTVVGADSAIISARLTSVDVEISTDYALPYPAGTEYSGRAAFGDVAGARQNTAFSNVPSGFVSATRAAAIIAAGWLMVLPDGTVGPAPTYCNVTVFNDTPSV